MPEPINNSIESFEGVTLEGVASDKSSVLRLLQAAMPIAIELILKATNEKVYSPLGMAALSAFQSVTALMSAVAPRCNLENPPKDIEAKVDGTGDMVYRCLHTPPHEWDLSGKRRV